MKKYNRYLRDLIAEDAADPSFVVTHEVGLDEAPGLYERFDDREEDVLKVLLQP